MTRPNLLIALCLLSIFASGAVVGIFATHLYDSTSVNAKAPPVRLTPEEWRNQYTREMQNRLNLNPEQMTAINVILDETGSKVHAERERHINEMKAIRLEQVAKTRDLLTDEQRSEYERLRKEREGRARTTHSAK